MPVTRITLRRGNGLLPRAAQALDGMVQARPAHDVRDHQCITHDAEEQAMMDADARHEQWLPHVLGLLDGTPSAHLAVGKLAHDACRLGGHRGRDPSLGLLDAALESRHEPTTMTRGQRVLGKAGYIAHWHQPPRMRTVNSVFLRGPWSRSFCTARA